MPTEIDTLSDHDLLIELRTELKGVRTDIKTFSDDTKERLAALEVKKLNKEDFTKFILEDTKDKDDKERRIRFLERWGWAAWGVIGFVEFALLAWLAYLHLHVVP